MIEVRLGPDDGGPRADRVLRKLLPRAPLALIHRLLRQGKVRRATTRLSAKDAIEGDATLTLFLTPAQFEEFRAPTRDPRTLRAAPTSRQALPPIPVIYEDEHLLAIDKPAGLAVQPGTGREELHVLAWLERHCHSSSQSLTGFRAAPAHRIDRPTSGLLLIGKTSAALRALAAAFREHEIRKTYLAVIEGHLPGEQGTIDLALDTEDQGKDRARARVSERGKIARTHWELRARGARCSLVEVVLETGRTHQIRAHFAALGHPLVGDGRYGAGRLAALPGNRIALHAAALELVHPTTRTPLRFTAPLPTELSELVGRIADPS